MDPKLIEAIVLRIKAGHSREKIQAEMLAVGYDEDFFESVYDQAFSVVEGKSSPESSDSSTSISVVNSDTDSGKEIVNNSLLSYQTLFSQSWTLTKENLPLLLKSVITFIGTFILSGIIGVILLTFVPSHGASVYVFILFILLFIFSLLALISCFNGLLRGLLKRADKQKFTKHFVWAYLNIVGLSLVAIYVSAVTQFGYLFLYIPGLMLNVYLLFAIYVAVDGQNKGVRALVTSTSLVYGRFWPVLGRVIISVIILFLLAFVFILLSTLTAFMNAFWVPTLILLAVIGILGTVFWQLCFTVTLYENLRSIPVAKTLPILEEKLTNIYRGIILLVVTGFLVIMTLIGLGILEVNEQDTSHSLMSDIEIAKDAKNKQMLKTASGVAFAYQSEMGTFDNVCEILTLPEGAVCQSSQTNFAIETPLVWGFYCLDDSGYNEVERRSKIESNSCRQDKY